MAEVAALAPPLKTPKYSLFADAHVELCNAFLIVVTAIGVEVPGINAKLVVVFVTVFVKKNANASEKLHW